jgi:hypothetical protein
MIDFVFRPIERWPQEPTPHYRQKKATFRVAYEKLLRELTHELSMLGVRKAYIQVDVTDRDIRQDGHLRSDSKPNTARVIVSAETKHGPISLPCDTYRHWKDNLRAISLSLEALRAVDRHGVTKRGEQYRGLKQLSAGTGPLNSEEAARFLSQHSTTPPSAILQSQDLYERARRDAALKLHPDKGGEISTWHIYQKAIALLDHHHEERKHS